MQPGDMSHQAMGYDRTSAMFSPDGRLLQVEYAKKTVKQGTTAIGIVCKDGALILADKRISEKLIVPKSVETDTLVKQISNIKQMYTQVGGARPFGVSLLFIGMIDEPQLFITDPTGIFFEYKATAMGEAENEVKEILNKEYRENLSMDDGLKLAVACLKKGLG